jgi:cell wall-associated NlpC family hydrolase
VWSGEQTANATLIIQVVAARGLPRRAAVVALATAIAESGLRNLPAGDRDSLGLFQQRPSQGWGRPGEILNPRLATGQFLTHLLAQPDWAHLAPGVAEQLVQQSGHPGAYAPREAAAADLVARYWTHPDPDDAPAPAVGAGPTRFAAFGLTRCPDQPHHVNPTQPPLAPTARFLTQVPAGYTLPTDPQAQAAVAFALAQVGKPYRWGATGPQAFDCSGLVHAAWATAHIAIGRTTATQIHDGIPVPGFDQIQPGDLLFIPGDEGSVSHPGHVGLAAGAGLVIDAYGSNTGIVIEPLARWAPKIVAIRRVTTVSAAGR